MLELIRQALDKDASLADDLLNSLDTYAREVDFTDYGIPLYDHHRDAARLIVIRWLLSIEEKAKS